MFAADPKDVDTLIPQPRGRAPALQNRIELIDEAMLQTCAWESTLAGRCETVGSGAPQFSP